MFKSNNIKVLIEISIMLGLFALCTLICYILSLFEVNVLNFMIIYVLGILITAVLTRGFCYSLLLSIMSVFGYNFFFTVPKYTFHFIDDSYIVTFILMLIVGVFISSVMYQFKKKVIQINKLNEEKARLKTEAEKEQMKATLLRSISHDLRTPLTTMKNGAEVLIDNETLDLSTQKEILASIVSKADWTIRLVENLLSLSRIDREKLSVKKKQEALEEIIPQAVRTIQGILGNRKIHYQMPPELLMVPMDATLIIQTISNILGNAIKHTKDDGNITIKVFNASKHCVFRISNDGDFIPEEDLPFIFESYYRGGDQSDSTDGVGLGLSICKLIVTAHGGQISARNLEKGVVFEFTLPMEENYD